MKNIIKEKILLGQKKDLKNIQQRNLSIPNNLGKIISIIGPRRSGKSSFLYAHIKKLLSEERVLHPYRVFFFLSSYLLNFLLAISKSLVVGRQCDICRFWLFEDYYCKNAEDVLPLQVTIILNKHNTVYKIRPSAPASTFALVWMTTLASTQIQLPAFLYLLYIYMHAVWSPTPRAGASRRNLAASRESGSLRTPTPDADVTTWARTYNNSPTRVVGLRRILHT